MALSLRPSTFTAGGLIDDIDAEVTRARFVVYDYDGKADPALCLHFLLKDNDGNDHANYWSAGSMQYFVPSEDPKNEDLNGITIVPVGDKQALNGGTNAAMLLNSLVNAGFPEDKLESGDVREIEGLKAHWNRVPQPKRSGLPSRPGQEKKDQTVLVISAILAMPGEARPAAKAPAKPVQSAAGRTSTPASRTASTSRSAPPASTGNGQANGLDADLLTELGGEIVGLFATRGVDSMKKVEITRGLFASIEKTNPNRNKLVGLAGRDEYLKGLEGFTFDGSVLTAE